MMMLGKPVDNYNYNLEMVLDPKNSDLTFEDPSTIEGLRSLNGLEDFPRIPIMELTSPVSRSIRKILPLDGR